MLKRYWKIGLAIFDWRTKIRWLKRAPIVDATFVTNFRDKSERERFVGNDLIPDGVEDGPRCYLKNTIGRIKAIDVLTGELLTNEGRKKARQFFLSAVRQAQQNGAQVILLAAATKRLFGRNGADLKAKFPELVFTIGDNGTSYLLNLEVNRALEKSGLAGQNPTIAVLGASGILGEQVCKSLSATNCKIVAVTSSAGRIDKVPAHPNQTVVCGIDRVGRVDAVVACTHLAKLKLNAEHIEQIRKPGRKLLVIDVAEPANLSFSEYQKCRNRVIRLDAGNGFSSRFKYVLQPLLSKMIHLLPGVTFGCFAEHPQSA